ncbi:hypothetical protein EIP91_008947 [Steccherinum ochraceum]|uniref:DUF6535 domain-containing protein n=1 Tax=Steccherinum ochraceum TaxID=92696 RepID=A0A4R0RTT3_9APHY|nr:hypothetical protein EIP91_008947 [Steccherinum ochraceum]
MSSPPDLLIPGDYTENIILDSPARSEAGDEPLRTPSSPAQFGHGRNRSGKRVLPQSLSRRPSSYTTHARSDSEAVPVFLPGGVLVESPAAIEYASPRRSAARMSTLSLPDEDKNVRIDRSLFPPRKEHESPSPRVARESRPPLTPNPRPFLRPKPVLVEEAARSRSRSKAVQGQAPLERSNTLQLENAGGQVYVKRSKRSAKSPVSSHRSSILHRQHKRSSRPSSRYRSDSGSSTDASNAGFQRYVEEKEWNTFTAWTACDKRLRRHDRSMVQAWKEDIDNILFFAGLFSAVLTTFNIEAYKLLQPDPEDSMVTLMRSILLQLGGTTFIQGSTSNFTVSAFAIRLNILWFSSLVFSLSAASVGILAKQWLQNYLSSSASSPRENARIRQFRYQGLVRWRVPEVIAFLPILVQVALALFFIGLADLLWKLNPWVAGIVTVFVATALAFVVVTTVTPTFSKHCPHKSPQSLAAYRVKQWITRGCMNALLRLLPSFRGESLPFPTYIPERMFKPRSWTRRLRAKCLGHVYGRHPHTWREREKDLMLREQEREPELDREVLATADRTFMDDPFLIGAVRTCLNDTDWPAAVRCLQDIITHRAHHFLNGVPQWRICSPESVDTGLYTLINLVADAMPRIHASKPEAIRDMVVYLEKLCVAFPFQAEHEEAEIAYRRTLACLSPLLLHENEMVWRPVHKLILAMISKSWNSEIDLEDDAPVIEDVVKFSKSALSKGHIDAFFDACTVALRLFTDTASLPISTDPAKTSPISQQIDDMLEDLQNQLTRTWRRHPNTPNPDSPNTIQPSSPRPYYPLRKFSTATSTTHNGGTSPDTPTSNTMEMHTPSVLLVRAIKEVALDHPHGLDIRNELVAVLLNIISEGRFRFDTSAEGESARGEFEELYERGKEKEKGPKKKRRDAWGPERMDTLSGSGLRVPTPLLLSAPSPPGMYARRSPSPRPLVRTPEASPDIRRHAKSSSLPLPM